MSSAAAKHSQLLGASATTCRAKSLIFETNDRRFNHHSRASEIGAIVSRAPRQRRTAMSRLTSSSVACIHIPMLPIRPVSRCLRQSSAAIVDSSTVASVVGSSRRAVIAVPSSSASRRLAVASPCRAQLRDPAPIEREEKPLFPALQVQMIALLICTSPLACSRSDHTSIDLSFRTNFRLDIDPNSPCDTAHA